MTRIGSRLPWRSSRSPRRAADTCGRSRRSSWRWRPCEKQIALARIELLKLVEEFPENPLFVKELAKLDAN
jgi:hypothetical protein